MSTVFHARVYVTLKSSVLDIQGGAVERALHTLGYGAVQAVRIGKTVEVTLDAPDAEAAQQQVEQMCARLLANPVMETYTVEFVRAADTRAESQETTACALQ